MEDAVAKQQDILALVRKVSNELKGPDYYRYRLDLAHMIVICNYKHFVVRYIKSVSPGLEEYVCHSFIAYTLGIRFSK